MRGDFQQGCRQLVARHDALLVFLFSTLVYLLTMDRSASWWDCGEFITTGWGLQVGHPPGAPFYQLVTHCVMLLSFGDPMWVAPLSNFVSVLCGGLTVMLLYLSLKMLLGGAVTDSVFGTPTPSSVFGTPLPPSQRGDGGGEKSPLGQERVLCQRNDGQGKLAPSLGALVGGLCYLFCDTAWFSAVESEVYGMAMLFCSLTVWLMLRWEREGDNRRLLLVALLLGLGVCVHLMTLLTLPALLWIFVRALRRMKGSERAQENGDCWRGWLWVRTVALGVAFFVIGLTPYAIIPIRAAVNPPINEGNPSNVERFKAYLGRDQYEKAPLYPRIWRERDSVNWKQWGAEDPTSLVDNALYYANYQLGYMYFRYLMYNFIGRENKAYRPESEEFSIFNFQFSIFILPFLLGLWGMWRQRRRRRGDFHLVLLLFLFGGIVLNLYLNHPCYEPRARDYAYVLSFYAFAVWIGIGAAEISEKWKARSGKWRYLLLLAPLLMAAGNWSDHDRHGCHSVHDISLNHLQSCDHGAILFSLGDNDTFPLWYLQQVERRRTDIDLYNVNLIGYRKTMALLDSNDFERPVYFTHYAYQRFKDHVLGWFRCEGFCWRLLPTPESADNPLPLRRHVADSIRWHIAEGEYLDHVSRSFMKIWERNSGQQ